MWFDSAPFDVDYCSSSKFERGFPYIPRSAARYSWVMRNLMRNSMRFFMRNLMRNPISFSMRNLMRNLMRNPVRNSMRNLTSFLMRSSEFFNENDEKFNEKLRGWFVWPVLLRRRLFRWAPTSAYI